MTNALPPLQTESASGWSASLELVFEPRPGKTVLSKRVQRGPLAVQRPFYPEQAPCHVYVLHPPGGIVGGDDLDIQTQVKSGAHSVITTPGATKFYRSQGALAEQRQQLMVADNATLEWLPQETIYFPGAIARLKTQIDLAPSATFLGWETHCLGLPANQQDFSEGEVELQFELYRDKQPLLLEKFSINSLSRRRPTGLRGFAVTATFVATPADEQALEATRTVLETSPACFSATLIEDCLLVRYLGQSTEESRNIFTEVLKKIRPLITGLQPCAPRIWST